MFGGLADFEGHWVLERRITQRDAPDAELRGSAVWRPTEGGMDYVETGLLRIGDQPAVNAERRYFWREGQGGVIEVLFHDGRAFHRIDPANPRDRHWCDPDSYDVVYDFSAWPEWSSTWRVRGPRKDYEMVSRYTFRASGKQRQGPHVPVAHFDRKRLH